MNDSNKCISYANINNDIKDISELVIGREFLAFIKNYRGDVIYCSLNLGVSGSIKDPASIQQLEYWNQFGDLIYVKLEGFERRRG